MAQVIERDLVLDQADFLNDTGNRNKGNPLRAGLLQAFQLTYGDVVGLVTYPTGAVERFQQSLPAVTCADKVEIRGFFPDRVV